MRARLTRQKIWWSAKHIMLGLFRVQSVSCFLSIPCRKFKINNAHADKRLVGMIEKWTFTIGFHDLGVIAHWVPKTGIFFPNQNVLEGVLNSFMCLHFVCSPNFTAHTSFKSKLIGVPFNITWICWMDLFDLFPLGKKMLDLAGICWNHRKIPNPMLLDAKKPLLLDAKKPSWCNETKWRSKCICFTIPWNFNRLSKQRSFTPMALLMEKQDLQQFMFHLLWICANVFQVPWVLWNMHAKKCRIKCNGVSHFVSSVIVRVASVAMPTLTLVCLDVFWPIYIPHGTWCLWFCRVQGYSFHFLAEIVFHFFGWQNPKRTAAILWLIGSAFWSSRKKRLRWHS